MDRLIHLTNSHRSAVDDFRSKCGHKTTVGNPVGTAEHTNEDLIALNYVGVYQVIKETAK